MHTKPKNINLHLLREHAWNCFLTEDNDFNHFIFFLFDINIMRGELVAHSTSFTLGGGGGGGHP